MALIDEVKAACDRLAPLGWRDMLLEVTGNALDIHQSSANALKTALLTPLNSIDRNFGGCTDFSASGKQGIDPGSPATSLLYHAFAAPGVARGITGPLAGFPSLREIESLENLIFGIVPPTLASIRQRAGLTGTQKLSIVLFAYEYRPARDTCGGGDAGLVFSRTGIARVGTRTAKYSAEHRGFDSESPEDPFAFQVCPARYGAFLSVRTKGSRQSSLPMRFQQGDASRDFWVPIHKLFDGTECIQGLSLHLQFSAFHYNDKVRRVQAFLKKNPPATAPFQFTDGIADFLNGPDLCQGLLCPTPHPRLIEEARQNGAFVTFRVPTNNQSGFAAFEPATTEDPTTGAEIRPAPAYVHARTQVKNGILHDLGSDPTNPDVLKNVRKGGYDALHYVDFTGDGRVDVVVEGLQNRPEVDGSTLPAYSLVAAPDFFPSAGQRELTEWAASSAVPASLRPNIWGVPPQPLCDTRLPANLQMPGNRFDSKEVTITTLVPLFGSPTASGKPPSLDALRHSCLPDDAAGVFAPGWDVSTDKIKTGSKTTHHLAAYGLGSPFPEDSKLCAALSTFWGTVAPDITRGMSINAGNPKLRHTVAPLTDDEIGQVGTLPWDGNPGPDVITLNGQSFAECESFLHVDYVRMALEGRFTSRLTARISSEEYQRRILAMAFIYSVLTDDPNDRFVLSFLRVQPGDAELQQAQIDTSTVLKGPTYRARIFRASEATEQPSPNSFRKRLLPILDERFFLVDPDNRIVLERPANQRFWGKRVLSL